MTVAQIGMMVAMVLYLVGMLFIGFKVSDKNATAGDFFLGGRSLGPFVTAMSAEASDMSSWLLMGLPGLAYLSGISDPGWTAIGLALGTYINCSSLRSVSVSIPRSMTPSRFRSSSQTVIMTGRRS